MLKNFFSKNMFIFIPLLIFLILVFIGYFIKDYWQNLVFCIASAVLGIVATFLVIDNYYKNNEIIENEKLLINLAQSFFQLVSNIYFSIIASYAIENYEINKKSFLNTELMINEVEKLINIVKTYSMNDYSKYKYNDKTQAQLNITKKNLDEIKDLFLYLPKTLDIYKNCFPILLDARKYFQYFELRIVNNDTMLDVDFSTIALSFLNNFNKNLLNEIKKLNNKDINKIIFH